MYYFWMAVIAIGVMPHVGQVIFAARYLDQQWQLLPANDLEEERVVVKRKRLIFHTPYILLKRYLIVPATFGYRRSQNIWWCTIPTRIQSITIGAFISVNIILCTCSYRVFPNNM
jgi:hypothetical protein